MFGNAGRYLKRLNGTFFQGLQNSSQKGKPRIPPGSSDPVSAFVACFKSKACHSKIFWNDEYYVNSSWIEKVCGPLLSGRRFSSKDSLDCCASFAPQGTGHFSHCHLRRNVFRGPKVLSIPSSYVELHI
jgi:hypothetical protein